MKVENVTCEGLLISTRNPSGLGLASLAWGDSFCFQWYDDESLFSFSVWVASSVRACQSRVVD